jgi:aminopeptidase-like protein
MSSQNIGNDIHQLIAELYPICRSITGDGFRQSMRILQKYIPFELHEAPTGTQVFDWVVPREWNIRDAWIKNSKGEKIVDFQQSNLHVLNYSTPIHRKVKLAELKEHLFSIPEHEDWIPYKTSYYKENWGFCVTHRQLEGMTDEEYEVCIDSSLEDGHLTYGEYLIKGELEDEFLISCHSCHPSMCNDNLSGMSVATHLAKYLSGQKTRYSYRFLFIPGTIGSITWLSLNEEKTANIKHGLVLACVGDPGFMHYKKTRRGDAEIDRAVSHVLKHSGAAYEIMDFSPYGYDERQYASPGFNLAVGNLSRTPHGRFPEYHTSADNLHFVKAESLADSFSRCVEIIHVIEHNKKYLNTNPKGEPQLGKRGLYSMMGGRKDASNYEMSLLWVLNLSDGQYTLLDIAERAGIPLASIQEAAQALLDCGLLVEADLSQSVDSAD